jgi:uncharacterized protein YoxC
MIPRLNPTDRLTIAAFGGEGNGMKAMPIYGVFFTFLQMVILDRNLQTLNQSLDELQEMREQMASMGSVLTSSNAKLLDLSKTIGNTIHGNTDIQDSIQGFADRIQGFSVSSLLQWRFPL